MSSERAQTSLQQDRPGPDAPAVASDPQLVLPASPAAPLNVVMVSMESPSADYVESFGSQPGLTPWLDALAHQRLMFNDLYATGLRTVRGLEGAGPVAAADTWSCGADAQAQQEPAERGRHLHQMDQQLLFIGSREPRLQKLYLTPSTMPALPSFLPLTGDE